ncbi:glycoside hydrolase [Puniceibacterium sp. IMCC21224]|uniref:WD40/YVTN/BNR-like repeat-containing protein n=1 Tax=Puniceibacterium sp. IMCC21224 TaxID=1618204 RepID=UPI00065D4BDA|nr:glycoside hydrolase [Puniceibacterium sp. IMCC21224]KMK67915.1 hypothetical protein IMCC21224_112792 [Puniceibacterium sp. IMCC21224]
MSQNTLPQKTTTLMVGTTKGAFLLTSDSDRIKWSVAGPFCDGWPINHMAADTTVGTYWAAGGGEWPGAGVWRSDNGTDWTLSKLANGKFDALLRDDPALAAEFGMEPAPPAPFTGEIDALWSLAHVGDTLFAGAKPAALYASHDGGDTWDKVPSLSDHPSADSWEPGGAGLTLHTIVTAADTPEKMWVGISAAGVFATEDGGKTWERRNRRDNQGNAPEHDHGGTPGACGHEVGHCVHNMVRAAPGTGAAGDLLYQQNHHGVFRSPDGGRSWSEISAGLPSTFGFPIAVHPRDPATLWVLPLNGDMAGRYPPDASAAVWMSRDGGDTWSARRDGLPARNCFFTVLRQAMTTDRAESVGVYFGTNSGSVFASTDSGETWREVARHLPTVLCVEALT